MNRARDVALIIAAAGGSAAAGEWCHGRPVRSFCHLPCYNYSNRTPGNPQSQTTSASIGLSFQDSMTPTIAGVSGSSSRRAVKVFQLAASELRVDHCRLTQVAISIVDDGTWIMNCNVEQDPNLVDDKLRPPLQRYQRNLFSVDVRGVGMAVVKDPPAQRVLGQPQFFHVAPAGFWVEKGQKRTMRWTGRCDQIGRYFELIDRVDVDLRYE